MTNSPNKNYNLQITGSNINTWGTVLNNNFSIIDANLGGTLSVNVAASSGSTFSLTSAQSQNLIHNVSGVLTGDVNYQFPSAGGIFFINNITSGAHSLIVTVLGGSNSINIPQGTVVPIYVDASVPAVGAATGTQYVFTAASVGGTANAITVPATLPSNYSLNAGDLLTLTPPSFNTGPATLTDPAGNTKAIKKVAATGIADLAAGDIGEFPLICQYDGTEWIGLNILLEGYETTVSTNQAVGFGNLFTPYVNTAPVTYTIDQSTTLSKIWYVDIFAQGGAATIAINASDKLNNGTTGAGLIMPIGASGRLYTDANGNLWLNGTALFAPLASPAFTGTPTAPTAASSVSNTQVATTAFVHAAAPPVMSAISGWLPTAISGTSTTAAVTVSTGQATDSTNAAIIAGAGYSWAVSNGNAINGYQGGATLPNSSTIHFFAATGANGTGSFASTSLAPTLPSGYSTYFRRLFSLNTNSSGALIGGTPIETEGGGLLFWLNTQLLDINVTNLGTARTLYTLTVPTGIKVQSLYRAQSNTSSTNIILTSGDETDVAPQSYGAVPMNDWFNSAGTYATSLVRDGILTTNTSGQIGARSNIASTGLDFVSRGFKDFRRS